MRSFYLLVVSLLLIPFPLTFLHADDDAPPVAIASPDTGTTYPYADLKSKSLVWDEKKQVLVARLTFLPPDTAQGIQQDTHEFTLPGVTLDKKQGIFYAPSRRTGELIPVAKYAKALFFKTIKILPNAVIRVNRLRGDITVILEALRPDDPALSAPASTNDTVIDIQKLL